MLPPTNVHDPSPASGNHRSNWEESCLSDELMVGTQPSAQPEADGRGKAQRPSSDRSKRKEGFDVRRSAFNAARPLVPVPELSTEDPHTEHAPAFYCTCVFLFARSGVAAA